MSSVLRHPMRLLVLLFLSIMYVTHRFFIYPMWSDNTPRLNSLVSNTPGSIELSLNRVAEQLHQSIPRDADKPITLSAKDDAVDQLPLALPTQHDVIPHLRLHLPYPLWAHGHFTFLHHTKHGIDAVQSSIASFRRREIPVDAIILDAFWWHPRHYLQVHPQLYPNGWSDVPSSVHVLLWMSALVPTATAEYHEGRARGYFMHRSGGNATDNPHIFLWPRADSPPLYGALLDVTNVHALEWFGEKVIALLHAHPNVMGFRCAGVDALVDGVRDLFGDIGHVDSALYRSLYYRYFLDLGRRVRGGSWLIVGRAVDSFGPYQYQPFAPRDTLFAGWVGDHPSTFEGLRESAMNVAHSGYHCYVSVGSVIGGSFPYDARRPDRYASSKLTEVEPHVADDIGMDRLEWRARTLLRDYRDQERRILLSTPSSVPLLNTPTSITHCTDAELSTSRQEELFLRWLQWGATLPFLISSGDEINIHASSARVNSLHGRLVREHRALSLYYATESADSLSHFFDSEFHFQNAMYNTPTSQLKSDPRALHCVVIPLSKRAIGFDEPLTNAGWSTRIGDNLVVIPVMHSFGYNNTQTLRRFLHDVDISLLQGDRWSTWISLSDPLVEVLTTNPADKTTILVTESTVLPSPSDLPLVLRRRDSIIPILLPLKGTNGSDWLGGADAVDHGHLALTSVVVFTVDVGLDARDGGPSPQVALTSPSSLVGRATEFVPAMNVTASRGEDNAGILFDVTFLQDELIDQKDGDNGSGGSTSDTDATDYLWDSFFSSPLENRDEVFDAWNSSLRIVVALSVTTSPQQKTTSPSSVEGCQCTFFPMDPAEDETTATCAVTTMTDSAHGMLPSLLHERHRLHQVPTIDSTDDEGGDEVPILRCHVTYVRGGLLDIHQVVLVTSITGRVGCTCS